MIDQSARSDNSPPPDGSGPPVESYARILARPALLVVTLLGIGFWQFKPKVEAPKVAPTIALAASTPEPEVAPPAPSQPVAKPPRRPTPPAPVIDQAAVAQAEASLTRPVASEPAPRLGWPRPNTRFRPRPCRPPRIRRKVARSPRGSRTRAAGLPP